MHTDYVILNNSTDAGSVDVPSTDSGSVGSAIATGRVNVRSGPGTSYSKFGTLKKGQRVAVWSIDGKWAEITWTGNLRGYVHMNYLKLEND